MTRRAFTLIELIVVMAISAVLLGLISYPVVWSFNFTRAAEAFSSAQRSARSLVTRMEREMAEAAYVLPNHGDSGAVIAILPDGRIKDTSVGEPESYVETRLEYAKIDFLKPAAGDPSLRGPGGGFINPDTGREDPTMQSPKGDPIMPAAPGYTLVRYWIGLRNPDLLYTNPYMRLVRGQFNGSDQIWPVHLGSENLFVLYRAEVPLYVWSRTQGRMVANDAFFAVDADGRPIINDPRFFNGLRLANPTTVQPVPVAIQTRLANWRRISRVLTENIRFDMLRPEYNLSNRRMNFDAFEPRVTPLVRFQPRRMSAEPAKASQAVAVGLEVDNAQKVGPETFSTELGSWSLQGMTIWPSIRTNAFGPLDFSAGALRQGLQTPSRMVLSESGGVFTLAGLGGGGSVPLMNVSAYQVLHSAQGLYPFTQAVGPASAGQPGSPSRHAPWNELFIPVVPDGRAGRVRASFDIREVGAGAAIDFNRRIPASAPNQGAGHPGGIHTGPASPVNSDPLSGDWGSFSWQDFDNANVGINRRFNKLWNDLPGLLPGIADARDRFAKRFAYLGGDGIEQPGGEPSPLDRRSVADGGSGWQRASIVPGSEVVIGPDQRPGPNYGQPVRYTRTTLRPVGPNEYFINYVDQKEPDWSAFGLTANYDPSSYDPSSLVSAILQPAFRAGYLEFNSRPGEPLPPGNIFVTYRFQFTEPADIVAVDYDSSKQVEINLTVQTFPNTTNPNPQQVSVRGSATVRNFLR